MGLEAVGHQHGFVIGALKEPQLFVEKQRIADHDVFLHIYRKVCNRFLLDQPVAGVDGQQFRIVQLNGMNADAVGIEREHILQQVCAVGPNMDIEFDPLNALIRIGQGRDAADAAGAVAEFGLRRRASQGQKG